MREPLGADALICAIYDAALDPSQWQPIAGQLARALRAGSASIHVQAREHVTMVSRTSNFTDEDALAYRTHYAAKDVLAKRASARAMNQVLTNSDLIPDAEWVETEIYRDFLSPRGIHHIAGGLIELPAAAVGVVAVHRDLRGQPFSTNEKTFLGRILPHLRNAIRVQHALTGSSLELHAARDFLERSTTALLVVDRGARLLAANTRGEHLLDRSLALTMIAGRVTAAQLSAHHRLTRLIEAAVDTAAGRDNRPGGIISIPAENQTPLSVTVTPLRPRQGGLTLADPAALLIVRDASERADITPLLGDLYGLTPSEALLASGLVNGLTTDEIALAHGVTLNTVRTQLKSVMT